MAQFPLAIYQNLAMSPARPGPKTELHTAKGTDPMTYWLMLFTFLVMAGDASAPPEVSEAGSDSFLSSLDASPEPEPEPNEPALSEIIADSTIEATVETTPLTENAVIMEGSMDSLIESTEVNSTDSSEELGILDSLREDWLDDYYRGFGVILYHPTANFDNQLQYPNGVFVNPGDQSNPTSSGVGGGFTIGDVKSDQLTSEWIFWMAQLQTNNIYDGPVLNPYTNATAFGTPGPINGNPAGQIILEQQMTLINVESKDRERVGNKKGKKLQFSSTSGWRYFYLGDRYREREFVVNSLPENASPRDTEMTMRAANVMFGGTGGQALDWRPHPTLSMAVEANFSALFNYVAASRDFRSPDSQSLYFHDYSDGWRLSGMFDLAATATWKPNDRFELFAGYQAFYFMNVAGARSMINFDLARHGNLPDSDSYWIHGLNFGATFRNPKPPKLACKEEAACRRCESDDDGWSFQFAFGPGSFDTHLDVSTESSSVGYEEDAGKDADPESPLNESEENAETGTIEAAAETLEPL